MPQFSIGSKRRLASCHLDIQRLFNEVIQHYNIRIIEGYRDKERQDKAYQDGNSTKKWPLSLHNHHPSMAIDVAPFPIDWENTNRFFYLAGLVEGIAEMMGIKIRWGGDWDSDKDFSDQRFNDLVHFEVVV